MTQPNFTRKLIRRTGIGIVAISLVTVNPVGLFVGTLLIFIGNIL